jgi:hypothetical protein
MDNLPKNLTPTQAACLLALCTQLRNLEEKVASVLQIALAQPDGPLCDQLIDRVSELDSIADVMTQALDAMAEAAAPRWMHYRPYCVEICLLLP